MKLGLNALITYQAQLAFLRRLCNTRYPSTVRRLIYRRFLKSKLLRQEKQDSLLGFRSRFAPVRIQLALSQIKTCLKRYLSNLNRSPRFLFLAPILGRTEHFRGLEVWRVWLSARNVDPELIEVAKVYGLRSWNLFWQVIFPFYAMCFMGTIPFGSFFAGISANQIGASSTIAIGRVACVLGSLAFVKYLEYDSPP